MPLLLATGPPTFTTPTGEVISMPLPDSSNFMKGDYQDETTYHQSALHVESINPDKKVRPMFTFGYRSLPLATAADLVRIYEQFPELTFTPRTILPADPGGAVSPSYLVRFVADIPFSVHPLGHYSVNIELESVRGGSVSDITTFPDYKTIIFSSGASVSTIGIGGPTSPIVISLGAIFPVPRSLSPDRILEEAYTTRNNVGAPEDDFFRTGPFPPQASVIIHSGISGPSTSITTADSFWDPISNRYIILHGKTGGLTPGVHRISRTGASVDTDWINLDPFFGTIVSNFGSMALHRDLNRLYVFGGAIPDKFGYMNYAASENPAVTTITGIPFSSGFGIRSLRWSEFDDKMYWMNDSVLYRADPDMATRTTVVDFSSHTTAEQHMVVHNFNREIYVAASSNGIWRVSIDFTDAQLPLSLSAFTQMHALSDVTGIGLWGPS